MILVHFWLLGNFGFEFFWVYLEEDEVVLYSLTLDIRSSADSISFNLGVLEGRARHSVVCELVGYLALWFCLNLGRTQLVVVFRFARASYM